MQKFFQFHSKLDLFRLFSMEHLMTIAIILVLVILLFVFRKEIQKQENKNKRFFRFSLAFLLLAFDASYHLWLVSENNWSLKTALPLHLSDLAVILAIVMLLTGSLRVFQFMYF